MRRSLDKIVFFADLRADGFVFCASSSELVSFAFFLRFRAYKKCTFRLDPFDPSDLLFVFNYFLLFKLFFGKASSF